MYLLVYLERLRVEDGDIREGLSPLNNNKINEKDQFENLHVFGHFWSFISTAYPLLLSTVTVSVFLMLELLK